MSLLEPQWGSYTPAYKEETRKSILEAQNGDVLVRLIPLEDYIFGTRSLSPKERVILETHWSNGGKEEIETAIENQRSTSKDAPIFLSLGVPPYCADDEICEYIILAGKEEAERYGGRPYHRFDPENPFSSERDGTLGSPPSATSVRTPSARTENDTLSISAATTATTQGSVDSGL